MYKSILLGIIGGFMLSCQSSKVVNSTISRDIDSLISLNNPRIFSGVVVIQKDDKKIYSRASGFSNFSNKSKLSLDNRFSTMSLAKQITATLVLLEVQKGKINLNEPVGTYLADLNYDWAKVVTVHHLLNNSSGIDSWDLQDKLIFEPGSAFKYSNIGYATLGKILERTTGKSYETLVTNLFNQCGMNSSFYPNAEAQKNLVKSYLLTNHQLKLVSHFSFATELFPASHLITTASDLSKWNNLLHSGEILKDEYYQKMVSYTIKNAHPLFGEKEIGYGYGLRINDQSQNLEIGHTGYSPAAGFTAVSLYYPKNKFSIVVLENVASDDFADAYFFEENIRNIVLKSQIVN